MDLPHHVLNNLVIHSKLAQPFFNGKQTEGQPL